jgi:hypothetical protein
MLQTCCKNCSAARDFRGIVPTVFGWEPLLPKLAVVEIVEPPLSLAREELRRLNEQLTERREPTKSPRAVSLGGAT